MAYKDVITESEIQLTFPNLIEPNEADAENHPNCYTASVWFDKNDEAMMEQWEQMHEDAIREKYGDKKPPRKYKPAELKDGDETYIDKNGEEKKQREGKWGFNIKANPLYPPIVKDEYGDDITEQSELGYTPKGYIKYRPFIYDNKYGQGMTLGVVAFMMTESGQTGGEPASDKGMEDMYKPKSDKLKDMGSDDDDDLVNS